MAFNWAILCPCSISQDKFKLLKQKGGDKYGYETLHN